MQQNHSSKSTQIKTSLENIKRLGQENIILKKKRNELKQREFKLVRDLSSFNNRYKKGFCDERTWKEGMTRFHCQLNDIGTKKQELNYTLIDSEREIDKWLDIAKTFISSPHVLTPPPTPFDTAAQKGKATPKAKFVIDLTEDSDDDESANKAKEKVIDNYIEEYCRENIGKDFVFLPADLPDLMENLGDVQFPSQAFNEIIDKEQQNEKVKQRQREQAQLVKMEPVETKLGINSSETKNIACNAMSVKILETRTVAKPPSSCTTTSSTFKNDLSIKSVVRKECTQKENQTFDTEDVENPNDDKNGEFVLLGSKEASSKEYYLPPSPSLSSSSSVSMSTDPTSNSFPFNPPQKPQLKSLDQQMYIANKMLNKRKKKRMKVKKVEALKRKCSGSEKIALGKKPNLYFTCYGQQGNTAKKLSSPKTLPQPLKQRRDFERNFFEDFNE